MNIEGTVTREEQGKIQEDNKSKKMKLKSKMLYFAFFCSMSFSCQNSNDMTEFKPIVSENRRLVEENQVVEPEFYSNLKLVLDHYKVEYKFENGIIYVKKDVYKEKELMMNYTIKARDKNWLIQVKSSQEE